MRSIAQRFWLATLGLSLLVALPLWALWYHGMMNGAVSNYRNFLTRTRALNQPTTATALLDEMQKRFPPPYNLWILDEDGRPIASPGMMRFPFARRPLPLPWRPNEAQAFEVPGRRMKLQIYRVDNHPTRYLVFGYHDRHLGEYRNLWWIGLALLVSAISSSGILIWYLRRKAAMAEAVLARLQGGDLAARLPVKGLDELGRFSLKFNRMADEIEGLVGRLKKSEQSRTEILEELAHDLRTPLTSILTIFESLADEGIASPEFYRECVATALPEIEYVNRLIQDLFLLAQMNEPKYEPVLREVDLRELLGREVRWFESAPAVRDRPIAFTLADRAEPGCVVTGDAHLLQRLFRNLLLNARRFASSSVQVELQASSDGGWDVCVHDDGPGFPPALLQTYGLARPQLQGGGVGRDSLGLGSIIVQTVARLHGSTIEASNRSAAGKVCGATVRVAFPALARQSTPPASRKTA